MIYWKKKPIHRNLKESPQAFPKGKELSVYLLSKLSKVMPYGWNNATQIQIFPFRAQP